MLSEKIIKKLRNDTMLSESRWPIAFKALCDPGRFKIFNLLIEHDDFCVSEIGRIVGQTLPAVSQQLKVLDNAGLVYKKRDGQSICYCLKKDDALVKNLISLIRNHK